MNKETWIDEVMQTAKQIKAVEGNPFLHIRIEATLREEQKVQRLQPRFVYALTTVIIIALVFNIYAWRNIKSNTTHSSGIQQVMQEYGWSTNDDYSMNYSK